MWTQFSVRNRDPLLVWVTRFLLTVAIITSCTKRKEPDRSVSDQVVAASRGYRESGETTPQNRTGFFSATGFAEAFYSEDRVVDDPFADSTRFFSSCLLLYHSYPYADTNEKMTSEVALLESISLLRGTVFGGAKFCRWADAASSAERQ